MPINYSSLVLSERKTRMYDIHECELSVERVKSGNGFYTEATDFFAINPRWNKKATKKKSNEKPSHTIQIFMDIVVAVVISAAIELNGA